MASDNDSTLSSPLSSVPSSPLTEFSRSPSPPSDVDIMGQIHRRPGQDNPYPSPPASQQTSQSGSPVPDGMDSGNHATDKDGPPTKRRRISKERTTEYLDLQSEGIAPDEQQQLDRVLDVLHNYQKIVVIAGAGISVSAGIPDFRSSTGLFRSLKDDYKIKGSGKHLFDASVYKDDVSTSSFHHMVSNMSRLTKDAKPSAFHHMIATIAQEERLLRLYSQNVDGIDTSLEPLKTAVPLRKDTDGKWPRTVQLHGGLGKMVCSKCHDLSDFDASLFDGPVPPPCPRCEEIDDIRTVHEGKRSHGIGKLRPRMVLYNEHNPDDEAIGMVTKEDLRRRPDAVIVVGTTLKVPGVRRIVREMCGVVRDRRVGTTIWINNDPPPPSKDLEDCWDIIISGPSDAVAEQAAMRQWDEPAENFAEVGDEDVQKASEKLLQVHLPRSSSHEPWPTLPVTHAKLEPLPSLCHRNNSFRPPSPDKRPREAMDRGPIDWSPIASRRHSVIPSIEAKGISGDSISLSPGRAVSVAPGLLTPTKSRRNSMTEQHLSAFTKLKDTGAKSKAKNGAKSSKPKEPAKKKSNVKYVKPYKPQQSQEKTKPGPKPKAKAKSQSGPKTKALTNTFKQSKTGGVSVTKDMKNNGQNPPHTPSKLRQVSNVSLNPLPPQDLRNNTSPVASLMGGELGDALDMKRKRISIESMMN